MNLSSKPPQAIGTTTMNEPTTEQQSSENTLLPSSSEKDILDQQLEADFALKKKKKRSTASTKSKQTNTTEPEDQENNTQHNHQQQPSSDQDKQPNNNQLQIYQEIMIEDKPTYDYSQLLNRLTHIIHEENPDLFDRKRFTLKPPQLIRIGSRKIVWVNFQEFCLAIHRDSEIIKQFILTELNTDGSIDGIGRLVIRGRITVRTLEALLRKYLKEYVICEMCKSLLTSLNRDSSSRLSFIVCQGCGSSRSVTAVKAGFHAQTRADRRALRLNN